MSKTAVTYYRITCLGIVMVLLAGSECGAAEPVPTPQNSSPSSKRSKFTGSFGEVFFFSSPVEVEHNPHGGATKASFTWDGYPLGTLLHLPIPDDAVMASMTETIPKSIKEQYGAKVVDHTEFDNAQECHFDLYTTVFEDKGTTFRFYVCTYFDTKRYTDPAQEMLRPRFGGYKFEFMMPEEKHALVRPCVEEIIATFKRPEDKGL